MMEPPGAAEETSVSRAMVFEQPGEPLRPATFRLPPLEPGEALVRVECCTVCGSDLHSLSGARSTPLPTILGHEVIGRICAVGQPPPQDVAGSRLEVGRRVTWSVAVSCFACDRCRGGLPQKCRRLAKYGHEVAEGRFALSGGFAEHLILRRGSSIVGLPEELSAELACPVNCATATVASAFRAAGSVAGRRVLVLGAGMLGLTATAFAVYRGAERVVVCDHDPSRLALAAEQGAAATCLWRDEAAAFGRQLETAGVDAEFDAVFECSGAAAAVERACETCDVGGVVVLVGSVSPSRPVSLDPEQIVRRCQTLKGVHNYAPADLLEAIRFLSSAPAAPLANLVSRSFALADANQAIQFAVQQRPVRVAIRPGGAPPDSPPPQHAE